MIERVLIVDDSGTARMMLRRCLEIAGLADAEFVEAGNGIEALDRLAEQPVDLVCTDLVMPEMTGDGLLKRLRARPRTHDLPVIVVTSAGNEARDQQLRDLGANAVLPKPVSPPMIIDVIDRLFGDPSDADDG